MTCYKLSTNSTTDWSQPPIGRYTSPILIYPHPHPPPENQKTETCLWNRSEINKHAMFRRCNGRVSFVAKKKKLSGREYVIYMDSSYLQQNHFEAAVWNKFMLSDIIWSHTHLVKALLINWEIQRIVLSEALFTIPKMQCDAKQWDPIGQGITFVWENIDGKPHSKTHLLEWTPN